MFRAPDYYTGLSLRLSEVMSDVGVNERVVTRKRRTMLLIEDMENITFRVTGEAGSTCFFGSQVESTTTRGLKSDIDSLVCHHNYNIITDYKDWEPGLINYMMIQEASVSPGYCLLQALHSDVPLPVTDAHQNYYFKDERGRVLVANTRFDDAIKQLVNLKKNGAASTLSESGIADTDIVQGLPCKTVPQEVRHWLHKHHQWPSHEVKQLAAQHPCYVIPVDYKTSDITGMEWRISTAHIERYMMFSLNMTHIRCYILMKMIQKTLTKPHCEDAISSYMCKNVLFHCIARTHADLWQEHRLMSCLQTCLLMLKHFILHVNCPHFINNENNLMFGRHSFNVRNTLLKLLKKLIKSKGQMLLKIDIDNIGTGLRMRMSGIVPEHYFIRSEIIQTDVCAQFDRFLVSKVTSLYNIILIKLCKHNMQECKVYLIRFITNICRFIRGNSRQQTASGLLFPSFCSSLGSVIASHEIQTNQALSKKAMFWLTLGVNSDLTSGRLKLASVIYCAGHVERCESILQYIQEQCVSELTETVCGCYDFVKTGRCEGFFSVAHESDPQVTAFCVKFLPCEIYCLPHELRYELQRSTQQDILHRNIINHEWMDLAAVDSLIFLYFLQYKTYGHLHRREDQQQALDNLIRIITNEPNLGHRETALNLLGQCMEQEKMVAEAFQCFVNSLRIRSRNNAAQFHIPRMIATAGLTQ